MRRPSLLLALAVALGAGVAGCGGDEPVALEPEGSARGAERADAPAGGEREARGRERTTESKRGERRGSRKRRSSKRSGEAREKRRDRSREGARKKAEERRSERGGGSAPRRERRSSQAELKRELDRAKAAVKAVIRAIDASDPEVCTRYFTQRYAEKVSGLEGDAAVAKCRRDIQSTQGSFKLTAFGPSRIEDSTALVRFNLEVNGQLTSEAYRLVLIRGQWLVDDAG